MLATIRCREPWKDWCYRSSTMCDACRPGHPPHRANRRLAGQPAMSLSCDHRSLASSSPRRSNHAYKQRASPGYVHGPESSFSRNSASTFTQAESGQDPCIVTAPPARSAINSCHCPMKTATPIAALPHSEVSGSSWSRVHTKLIE